MSRDETDEALMARYQGGDEDAFRELYERYAGRLTGLMRRDVRSAADVQDLVQQTFFQLHRARHDFKTGHQVRPWLMTIALNLKRRYFRDAHKRGASLEVEPSQESQAGRDVELAETSVQVADALATLPAGTREVIELHWFQGLPFSEVAKVVGASLSAVKVRAHRGYKRLRAELEGK